MHLITEGSIKFYASKADDGKISKELEVFYNPVMKFNRDVSVLLLNALDRKNLKIADIMAGSGIRSLRFLKELNQGIIKKIAVNDYDDNFVATFKKNLSLNAIDEDTLPLTVASKDANIFLRESRGFDYIDIDPFGSPNPFLDAAIDRIARKGILAVTATDTAPLCGTYVDACRRKYWAEPLRNHLMHEIGLRILIRKVQLVGVQYEKVLMPIYSYAKDHYFRIFFHCEKSKKSCDEIISQHHYALYCKECMTVHPSIPNHGICSSCNKPFIHAGKLWTGRLWDEPLAQAIAKHNVEKSNTRFLQMIAEESQHQDIGMGFYDIHEIAKRYKLTVPNFSQLMEKIRKKGYPCTRTIFSEYGIKTAMPLTALILLMQ